MYIHIKLKQHSWPRLFTQKFPPSYFSFVLNSYFSSIREVRRVFWLLPFRGPFFKGLETQTASSLHNSLPSRFQGDRGFPPVPIVKKKRPNCETSGVSSKRVRVRPRCTETQQLSGKLPLRCLFLGGKHKYLTFLLHNLKTKDDILGREGILFGSTKTSKLAENPFSPKQESSFECLNI